MKTPTWATTVAILMIVFGGCSILNDFQAIKLPDAIEKGKKEMEKELKEEREHATDTTATASTDSTAVQKASEEDRKKAEEILNIPEFSKIWIVRFGYIGLGSTLVYFVGAVFLFVKKRFSIKLAYAALAVSILTSGAQLAVLTSSSSSGMIALWTGLGQLLGIIIDIILLAVIFASDKEAYQFPQNQPS